MTDAPSSKTKARGPRASTRKLLRDLIRKVRVVAARRNRSVSALLRHKLNRLVTEDLAYETAKRAALERLERGAHLGGGRFLTERTYTIVRTFVDTNILVYARLLTSP